MGSGPGTGGKSRSGGASDFTLSAGAGETPNLDQAMAELVSETPHLDQEMQALAEATPPDSLDLSQSEQFVMPPSMQDILNEVVSQAQAKKSVGGLPQPGSFEDAVRLGQEFEQRLGPGGKVSFGFFDGKAVYLNSTILRNARTAAKLQKMNASSGWFSSALPSGTAHHEIGHALHLRNLSQGAGPKMTKETGGAFTSFLQKVLGIGGKHGKVQARWSALASRKMSARLAKSIGRDVSKYAATNRLEIVAEMYAGMKAGKTYPPRLMKYYRALGGPSV